MATSERPPRITRGGEAIDGQSLDLDVVHDGAIQIWPWEEAPEVLREGWTEVFPLLVYIPERFVKHSFVRLLFGRLSHRREEGDGAIVIGFEVDVPV